MTVPLAPCQPARTFSIFVVIPVLAELDYIFGTLESLVANGPQWLAETMVLLVINNPPDPDPGVLRENQALLRELREARELRDSLNLFWLDASSPGCEIRKDPGVGAARKLGMDTCLSFADWDHDPLVCCLDADSPVADNYLDAVSKTFREHPDWGGAVVNYRHQAGDDAAEDAAITDYELFLRQYELGLKIAGSPYAYHSIGSTIVCRLDAYVKSGGMRVRQAGEDFYFLQALRKIGDIGEVMSTCVYPSARPSSRVPFGTGPRVKELVAGQSQQFYNPSVFTLLRVLNQMLDSLSTTELQELDQTYQTRFPEEVSQYLTSLSFAGSWRKIQNNTPADETPLRRAFHIWFDALKTLKFIHFCEQTFAGRFHRVDWRDAFTFLSLPTPEMAKKELLTQMRTWQ